MTSAQTVYDELAPGYDSAYLSPVDLAEDRTIARAIQGIQEPVLDLGCGTVHAALSHQVQAEYVGVDVSPGMLAVARQKHPGGRFVAADVAALPFGARGRPFGAVTALFGVLSMVQDPQAVITAALDHCVTWPDVFLMFCSPSRARRPFPGPQRDLFRFYSAADVARIVADLGPGVTLRGIRGPLSRLLGAGMVEPEFNTLGRWAPGSCDYIIAERIGARG